MGDYNLIAYLAMQKREIDEHKWYLSEGMGKDVSYAETLQDWTIDHAKRFHGAFFENIDLVNRVCRVYCKEDCKAKKEGIDNCILSIKQIHKILKD